MFTNQLSAKELYSTNPSQYLQRSEFRGDQDDSAFNSSQTMSQTNSHVMSSQMENSQSSSFDMFSQMMMSQQQSFSQQTENGNNPQRFYMKYMSKAPLFNKDPDKNPLSRKRSFQEQLDSNKQKAKERDDRDLINTFISLVRECTEEVKSAATDIRKDVDKNISESASQFGSLIQKINEDLKNYHHTLLSAMKVKDDQRATLEEMQQNLAARDAKIEVLEMQLDAARQQREEHVVESLLGAYTEQQKMNRQQIDKMQVEQQAFCKTQMDRLKQEQVQYLLRCESQKEVAKATEVPAVQDRRDDHEAGLRLVAPMTGVDNRPCSWQSLPQCEQREQHIQLMSSYQQNQAYQNKMMQTHPSNSIPCQNDINHVSPMVSSSSASFGNHGNHVSLPAASIAWSAPVRIPKRQSYVKTGSQCHAFSVSAVDQRARTIIPNLQTGNNFDRDGRSSGYIFQQGNSVVPQFMSPTGTANSSEQWNTLNKLKPSPVAAVAPQVKPKELVHPRGQNNQESREASRFKTPQVTVTKKKKGRKRYQVAVKTKRQSSRARAKQNDTSCESKNHQVRVQENQPQHGQRGRQTSKNIPTVDLTQPVQTKRPHLQAKLEDDEDVYEYKEPERERVRSAQKKPQGKKKCRSHKKSSSGNEIKKMVQGIQECQPKEKCNGRRTSKVTNSVPKDQPKVTDHPTKMADDGVCKYLEPEKTVPCIRKRVRGKQGHQSQQRSADGPAHQPSQDGIFSQKRVTTYVRRQDVRSEIEAVKHTGRGAENLNVKCQRSHKPNICYESSSEDEEIESQYTDMDQSEDLASQDKSLSDEFLIDEEDITEQVTKSSARRMKVQRRTKQRPAIIKKPVDKLVGPPKEHGVSQLDTVASYSAQEDSSEEMTFFLKLPDSLRHQNVSLQQAKKPLQTGEQVVPVIRNSDTRSSPYIHDDQDSDDESNGAANSICISSGRKMSRQTERKRILTHSSSPAVMAKITNSLRLQQHKYHILQTQLPTRSHIL